MKGIACEPCGLPDVSRPHGRALPLAAQGPRSSAFCALLAAVLICVSAAPLRAQEPCSEGLAALLREIRAHIAAGRTTEALDTIDNGASIVADCSRGKLELTEEYF